MIPGIEKKSKTEIKKYQEGRLQDLMKYLSSNSMFYKRMFREHKIDSNNIKSLEDLTKVPVTTKDDLQKYNNDFFCVEQSKVVDLFRLMFCICFVFMNVFTMCVKKLTEET